MPSARKRPRPKQERHAPGRGDRDEQREGKRERGEARERLPQHRCEMALPVGPDERPLHRVRRFCRLVFRMGRDRRREARQRHRLRRVVHGRMQEVVHHTPVQNRREQPHGEQRCADAERPLAHEGGAIAPRQAHPAGADPPHGRVTQRRSSDRQRPEPLAHGRNDQESPGDRGGEPDPGHRDDAEAVRDREQEGERHRRGHDLLHGDGHPEALLALEEGHRHRGRGEEHERGNPDSHQQHGQIARRPVVAGGEHIHQQR